LASLILVVNVVGKLQQKRTRAASRGFLAAARLSCSFWLRVLVSWILSYRVHVKLFYRIVSYISRPTYFHCHFRARNSSLL